MRGLLQKASRLQYKNNKICNDIIKMAKDPVCGMEVDEKAAEYSIVKNGKKYYFCSENCYTEFNKKK